MFFVKFWGVRGSIACPSPAHVRYGGNTSCVEVRADDGSVIILDCGTGARPLGLDLLARGPALPPPAGARLAWSQPKKKGERNGT